MNAHFLITMDLLLAACLGKPMYHNSPPCQIIARYWTGPVGQKGGCGSIYSRHFSLFLERKEVLLVFKHWNHRK